MCEPQIKPERIKHASKTQFGIARHYGRCIVNGAFYRHDKYRDELVREDVWNEEMAAIKEKRDEYAKAEKEKWLNVQKELF